YQWRAGAIGSGVFTNLVNGGNITGVTNSVLTMTNISVANQADYIVVVANSAGAVTSSVPTSLYVPPLTVTGPNPASATVYPGGTVNFSISALGAQPITYQWQRIVGGVTNLISGATNNSLILQNVSAGDVAAYQVVVTTPIAVTNSAQATLSLLSAPTDTYAQTVMTLQPVAYWRLGEGSGTISTDYAGAHNGTYGASAFLSDPGPNFSGFPSGNYSLGSLNGTVNCSMTVTANNALNLNTNTLSIVAWVNPTTLNPKAGIVFARNQAAGSTDVEGLNLTANNTLGYTWNNSAASLGWDSGLNLPVGVWSLVALVVTPTNATIYRYNANQQETAVFTTANAIVPFSGQLNINNDSQAADASRVFGADTAEVGVFNRALSANDIANLYMAGSGAAVMPSISAGPQAVSILPGHTAHFTVAAAGSGPLYYYWLKDGVNLTDGGQIAGAFTSTLTISGATAGNVGDYSVMVSNVAGTVTSTAVALSLLPVPTSFQNTTLQLGALGYWPLNESSGSSAYDYSGNNLHGTYVAPLAQGAAGPNPPYLGFDATDNFATELAMATGNSYVSLPPLGVTSTNMSFAAWIYPESIGNGSNQAPSAGIIFNRSSTTSGLCFRNDGIQLGYNWNNDPATYGHASGLIPPTNQWSFVALVVTPTNATIYLYNTNGIAHDVLINPHQAAAFTAETRIGSDAQGGRNFNGRIEQAVVYNYSLSAQQIAQVYTNGSGVALPLQPGDAHLTIATQPGGQIILNWAAGTLLEATNLTGPWVTNTAPAPYSPPVSSGQKYYRIRLQ
ncbi:MAG TPA: LamG-like jellyroll fold domain-containing protein, partial [Verrucomicrobiae bacterium]